jgi:Transposase DDE domain
MPHIKVIFAILQFKNVNKNTKEVVFIVSSIKRTAKEHVIEYGKRWAVEKFFRTSKQHLGLIDCQSTSNKKQRLHIFSALISYAILETTRIDKKKKSIEDVLHLIRHQNSMF